MTAVTQPRRAAPPLMLFRGGRIYLWLTLVAVALAALSLTYPSTPSYDPWSWLIWGREIFHGMPLHIDGGSSWKPLPVIFTTVFALFGSAQPNLWLLVARAGACLTVLMTGRLTFRLTRALVSEHSTRLEGGGAVLGRGPAAGWAATAAPAAFAAAAAMVCVAFAPGSSFPSFAVNMLLGYSEGVMTAGFLIAVERAWSGHHRQAFALGIIPCLDRPEVWPIWLLYGMWLMWKDRGARVLVVALWVLMLALWGVPQKLSGDSLASLFSHAQQNHSAHSAAGSFWKELVHVLRPLVIARLEIATILLIIVAGLLLLRAWSRSAGGWRAALRERPATATAALAGIFGYAWFVGISLETGVFGFAGNPRYAVIGVVFLVMCGCAAYGWACLGLAALVQRSLARLGRRRGRERAVSPGDFGRLLGACTLAVVLVFALVPGRFTATMPTISGIRTAMRYQARLREGMAALIKHAGGAKRVVKCGSMMTDNLQVTMLAWYLDVPNIGWIHALPLKPDTGAGPNVVFQDGPTGSSPRDQGPKPAQMVAWNEGWRRMNGSHYTVVKADPVTLYTDCSVYHNQHF